jgi:hypothetical protein
MDANVLFPTPIGRVSIDGLFGPPALARHRRVRSPRGPARLRLASRNSVRCHLRVANLNIGSAVFAILPTPNPLRAALGGPFLARQGRAAIAASALILARCPGEERAILIVPQPGADGSVGWPLLAACADAWACAACFSFTFA